MLEQLDEWLEQWRKSVWDGLYRREELKVRQLISEAWEAWEAHAGGEDVKAALRLYLDYLDYQAADAFMPLIEDHDELLLDAIRHLSQQVDTPLAKTMQARILLALKCWAHHNKTCELAAEDVRDWLALIPHEDLDHQTFSYLAFWAFAVGEVEYLEKAYRFFLLESVAFMVDFSRQRLKVMLALTENRCEPKDVAKLIDLLPHLMHATWLGEHILPVCKQQQVWNSQLQQQLEAKTLYLKSNPPEVPPREQPLVFQINF